MVIALSASAVSLILALLAFSLVARPILWVRLWDPWRRYVGIRSMPAHRVGGLWGVRLRSAMVGMILLLIAAFLPVATAQLIKGPPEDPGMARPAKKPPVFDLRVQPRHCSAPMEQPAKLSDRLKESPSDTNAL